MKLYSHLFCDDVIVTSKLYEEFYEKFANARYFDEEKVVDVIYYAYEIFEEMESNITKRRLLFKIADIADEIPLEEIFELKHYEIKRLLYVPKSTIKNALEKIALNVSENFELVDPEE
jgi:hypothetical protein